MILAINTDCNIITATPETSYLTNLQSGNPTTCCTYLELGVNCCTTEKLCLRSLYVLDYSLTSCGISGAYNYFDITYTGIDISCVKEIEYTDLLTGLPVIETNPTDLVVRFQYSAAGTLAVDLKVRTCDDLCLEYLVEGDITIPNYLDPCTHNDTGPTTTRPALPAGVTIVGTDLLITPEAFGQTGTEFGDGVYYVALVQDNVPESDAIFIDCDVQCRVIDYISKDPCSNIYAIYQGLLFAGLCTTISYTQMCSMWNYLGQKLSYFNTSPCETGSDCGCN